MKGLLFHEGGPFLFRIVEGKLRWIKVMGTILKEELEEKCSNGFDWCSKGSRISEERSPIRLIGVPKEVELGKKGHQ